MTRSLLTLAIAALTIPAGLQAAESLDASKLETFRPYKLDKCLVSDEKLGSMGEGISIVHQGLEITFCCKGCIRTFAKKPNHYLQEMKKAEMGKTGKGHQGHDHSQH